MKNLILFFALILSLLSCQKDNKSEADYSLEKLDKVSGTKNAASEVTEVEVSGNNLASGSLNSYAVSDVSSTTNQEQTKPEDYKPKKKVIRNASIRFQVNDYKKTGPELDKMIKQAGGYIASSYEENSSTGLQTTVSIRVPAQNFDALLTKLETLSKYLNYKNITSEDITSQYIDTETRLKTKREVEKRYLEILKQAKTIKDILNVEEQLRVIREEIEAKEGMLKYWNEQVSFSKIDLQYYESIEFVKDQEDSYFIKLLKGLKAGWDGIAAFVVGIFYVWPLILVAGVAFIMFRRWKRKK